MNFSADANSVVEIDISKAFASVKKTLKGRKRKPWNLSTVNSKIFSFRLNEMEKEIKTTGC